MSLQILLLIVGGLWIIYKYLAKDVNYFESLGIKYLKSVPLLGITYDMLKNKEPMGLVLKKGYDQFRNSRFFGVFEYTNPIIVIRDPELIKQISIKDFNHFVNHRFVFDENVDKIFGRALFSLKDQKWRDMRNTLSPAFTGSKMRLMLALMVDCSNSFTNYLVKKAEKEGDLEMEVKSLYERFANDIIAKCAFGVNVNSLENPDNEFYQTGLKSSIFSTFTQLKLMCFSVFPNLMKKLKMTLMDENSTKYFTRVISENVKFRKENNVVINDMLNLMIQAQKEGKIALVDEEDFQSAGFATAHESKEAFKNSNLVSKWDIDDIVSNAYQFLFAGFDTVSTGIHFLFYELALNQDIQQRLYEEIRDTNESLNGKFPTYEILQKMEYMDMVVSESLRKWPPAAVLDRNCVKSYVIQDNNGSQVLLKPGNTILFPAFAIMRDPQYFPDPEKFDPERFSRENSKNINESTYIPFGIGPRNCIGSRFALMELKIAFYFLLLKFQAKLSEKTDSPLKFKTDTFQIRARNGVWINFILRNNK